MADAILIAILICVVFLIIRSFLKKLARGESGCGCGCSSCSSASQCRSEKPEKSAENTK